MTLLLTNDDGIDAPGLAALRQAVSGRVIIAAPADPVSECGHRVTTKQPIRVDERGPDIYAIHGTPADCVRLAVRQLVGGETIDWVLSGINAGGNLGVDTYISGTVAAAREAAILGISSVALSQYRRAGGDADWPQSTAWAKTIFRLIQRQSPPDRGLWNVNFPFLTNGKGIPEVVFCPASREPLPVQYQSHPDGGWQYSGVYQERERETHSDVAACFDGKIAISRIEI